MRSTGSSTRARPSGGSRATTSRPLCDPGSYAVIGAAIVAYAAMARGAKRATAAATLLIVDRDQLAGAQAGLAAVQVLRRVPAARRRSKRRHSRAATRTAAMTLALALVLVAPRSYRPLAALVGAPFAIAMGLSVVLMGWHLPSDVFGGYLLAAAWCLGDPRRPQDWSSAAALNGPRSRRPQGNGLAVAGATGIVGLTLATGIALSTADGLTTFAAEHTAATFVATLMALAGTATVAAIALVASRRHLTPTGAILSPVKRSVCREVR